MVQFKASSLDSYRTFIRFQHNSCMFLYLGTSVWNSAFLWLLSDLTDFQTVSLNARGRFEHDL